MLNPSMQTVVCLGLLNEPVETEDTSSHVEQPQAKTATSSGMVSHELPMQLVELGRKVSKGTA